MLLTLEEILMLCKNNNRIYIYGAGKHAESLFRFLQEKEIEIYGFVVSDMEGNPENLFGKSIIEVKDFPKAQDSIVLVSITKSSIHYISVFEKIIKNQIRKVVFLADELMKVIKQEVDQQEFEKKLETYFDAGVYYLGENISVEAYHKVLVMKGTDGKEYHWRIGRTFIKECNVNKIADLFTIKTAIEEFEEQYGTYYVLHDLEAEVSERKVSCSIYMAYSHVDKIVIRNNIPQWIIPIQVGAALTDLSNQFDVRDDMGENISEKNGNYSECTAIYWMWKYAPKTDYIGLCHYRRHFDISENEFLKLKENKISVLVTSPTFVAEGIEAFFSTLTPHTDIEMLLKSLSAIYPEYLATAELFFKSRFFPPCNLFIMRYDVFQEYAQFLFSITFEVERLYNDMRVYRKDRYMGFLAECLLGIFLMHNRERLKIAYADMIFYKENK